jgi:propanediol dehydratase small subunit
MRLDDPLRNVESEAEAARTVGRPQLAKAFENRVELVSGIPIPVSATAMMHAVSIRAARMVVHKPAR